MHTLAQSFTDRVNYIRIDGQMNKALVFKIILILLLLTGITIFGSKAWKDYQVEQDQQKMQAMFSQILEGASTEPPAIKIDYKKKLAKESPLIFSIQQSQQPHMRVA